MPRFRSLLSRLLPCAIFALAQLSLCAAADAPEKRRFDLPAGAAETTLKAFSEQSGRALIAGTALVQGVRTQAVRGEFPAREALERMLAGTGLVVAQDEKSGAFTVRREGTDPNVARAPRQTASVRPDQPSETPASAHPPQAARSEDGVVSLSPFEVSTSTDVGYETLNSNSITGLNMPLVNVPVTAEIYNRQFFDDVGISSIEAALLGWASGQSPNGKPTTGVFNEGDSVGNTPFVIRGIPAGDSPRVDGFLTGALTFLDNTTQERTEIIRGPQSLLYGSAGAAGLINVVTKQANFSRNTGRLSVRTDRYGTLRGEVDYNQVLRPNLALRAAYTHGKEWFYADNSAKAVDAWFLAAAYRPVRRVTLRVNGGITTIDKVNGVDVVFAQPGDPRNQSDLTLLLARGQTSNLFNNRIDWSNSDALGGVTIVGYKMPSLGMSSDIEIAPWLNLRLMGGYNRYNNDDGTRVQNSPGLLAPGATGNPTGRWAVGGRPDRFHFSLDDSGVRALLNAKFNVFRDRIRSDFTIGAESKRQRIAGATDRYYQVDASGNFVVNAAQRANNDAGRTQMPVIFWSIEDGSDGPFRRGETEYVVNGVTYRRGQQQVAGVVAPTPTNPLGMNGTALPTDNTTRTKGYFASLYSEWFGNKFSTLGGVRRDNVSQVLEDTRSYRVWTTTWSAGAVYHINDYLSPYYNYSLSFIPNFQGARTQDNKPAGVNNGVGSEVGLKFSLPRWHVSGSVAAYDIDVKNNIATLPQTTTDIVNYSSPINGRHLQGSLAYLADYTVRGLELSMTASPNRDWRTRLSVSYNSDKAGRRVALTRWYNDEFNVNSTGQVLFNDGSLATVPSVAADPNSPRVPLTVAMMKDAASGYGAQIDAGSGRILTLGGRTFASLGLVGAASGLTIGTGNTGLPITSHQLGWVPPTPDFVVNDGGDHLAIPRATFSASAVRTFHEGWLRGVSVGLTALVREHQLAYYYLDAAAGNARKQRFLPDQFNTNLMVSYRLKLFSKYSLTTQINVTNLLNHRDLVYILNTGSGVPISAKMNMVPRAWVWSNTITF